MIPTGLYTDYMSTVAPKSPEATQRRILEAAFLEFYKNGFQGGSLNHIVAAAGTTKGALFHHFDGKQQLGYAVMDNVIGPLLSQRWLDPLEDTSDPLSAIQLGFRRYVHEDIESGFWIQGCPLNNMAQEMSPLDEGFHERINHLYDRWREQIAIALQRGMDEGTVRKDIDPKKVATLVVAAQMGIWGTGKSSQNKEVMMQAAETLCEYLDSLRP
jgi:TetR/AcrR family transcriptional regulator, transcriptional repressor for nem operon